MRITERTFGLELEYANVEKTKVIMPSGYTWDEDEVVHNSDGSKGTHAYKYGGEINTPPLLLKHDDLEGLKALVESCAKNGAYGIRDLALQVHIWVGDLPVEKIKDIFYLTYYTSGILKELGHEPQYSDEQRYRPSPTLQYYYRVKNCENTKDGLRKVLENSSNKGFVRHIISISSYVVRDTIEFRMFNSTTDWQETLNCILFAYRFIDYAIKHTEEDFKKITSKEIFMRELKVKDNLPALPHPPIFLSNVEREDRSEYTHRALEITSPMAKEVCKIVDKHFISVNPRLYSLELKLAQEKTMTVYNNDELNHILYLMATQGLTIHYKDKASFLERYSTKEPSAQIACLLAFHRIRKYFKDGEYFEKTLQSYVDAIDETIRKAKPVAEKMLSLLQTVDYRLGTLNDAISQGGDIFFQFDDYGKYRTTVGKLKKYSDYSGSFERKLTEYKDIPYNLPNGATLTMASTNQYLDIPKVAKNEETVLYSTKRTNENAIANKKEHIESATFITPPDDLDICDIKKLKIVRVKPSILHIAQDLYIKKVEKTSGSRFSFLVFYDKYLLGGFGFDLPRHRGYDEYDLWLLSDFCTNNNIFRLSKFILYLIKTDYVKRSLSRARRKDQSTVFTKVYTHLPVSMKYRGVFDKVGREDNNLLYETTLGTMGSIQDAFDKYQKLKKKK